MPLDTTAPVYTDAQKEIWDFMAEQVRKHPAQDVLDALADAYLHADPAYDLDSKRAGFIGRELSLLSAEHAHPSRPAPSRERPHSTIGARAKLSTYRRKPPITLPPSKFLEPEAV